MAFVPLTSMYDVAVSMKESFLANTGGNIEGGALALAVFFTLYIFMGVAVKLFSGQQFPWQEVFRPFIIILAISFWQPTLALFDSIGEHANSFLDARFGAESDSFSGINALHAARDAVSGIHEDLEGSNPTPAPETGAGGGPGTQFGAVPGGEYDMNNIVVDFFKGTFESMGIGRKPLKSFLFEYILGGNTGLSWLFEIIYQIVHGVMVILSQMYLAFFALVGPFAFAFGVIPQLNRISQWIASYIQYWLWNPTICLIHGMTNFLCGKSGGLINSGLYNATHGALGSNSAMDAMMGNVTNIESCFDVLMFSTVAFVAGIFMLLSVPKICSVIVNAGSDVISGKLGSFVSGAASTGGKAMLGIR